MLFPCASPVVCPCEQWETTVSVFFLGTLFIECVLSNHTIFVSGAQVLRTCHQLILQDPRQEPLLLCNLFTNNGFVGRGVGVSVILGCGVGSSGALQVSSVV